MGQVLYLNEPLYHEIVDYCADFLLTELGFDLWDKIHIVEGVSDSDAEIELTRTTIAQPGLFVMEYAMARLFMARGLQPNAMLGHSLGELVTACLNDGTDSERIHQRA